MSDLVKYCIDSELSFARHHFPGNSMMLAALMEEVGELAQALIDHSRGKVPSSKVYGEAVQVATMAIRVAEEGSGEFPYRFSIKCYQDFPVGVERETRKP